MHTYRRTCCHITTDCQSFKTRKPLSVWPVQVFTSCLSFLSNNTLNGKAYSSRGMESLAILSVHNAAFSEAPVNSSLASVAPATTLPLSVHGRLDSLSFFAGYLVGLRRFDTYAAVYRRNTSWRAFPVSRDFQQMLQGWTPSRRLI